MCARRPQLTHANSTNGVDIAATHNTSNGSSPFASMVARSCPKPILMPRRSRQGSLANHDELTVFVPPHELAASSLLDPTNVSRGHACGGTEGPARAVRKPPSSCSSLCQQSVHTCKAHTAPSPCACCRLNRCPTACAARAVPPSGCALVCCAAPASWRGTQRHSSLRPQPPASGSDMGTR